VRAPGLLLLALTLAVAACGCSSGQKTLHSFAETKRNCTGSKVPAKRALQRRKLKADLSRLRAAAATVNGYTQNGNAVLNKAVDRFALDVAVEALPVHKRSRYIDRAAAIVAPRCYLCFQALEANRPVAAGAKLPCD
jgi:hypothetical protein